MNGGDRNLYPWQNRLLISILIITITKFSNPNPNPNPKQMELPLRGRPILLITCTITDRIGLHYVH